VPLTVNFLSGRDDSFLVLVVLPLVVECPREGDDEDDDEDEVWLRPKAALCFRENPLHFDIRGSYAEKNSMTQTQPIPQEVALFPRGDRRDQPKGVRVRTSGGTSSKSGSLRFGRMTVLSPAR